MKLVVINRYNLRSESEPQKIFLHEVVWKNVLEFWNETLNFSFFRLKFKCFKKAETKSLQIAID